MCRGQVYCCLGVCAWTLATACNLLCRGTSGVSAQLCPGSDTACLCSHPPGACACSNSALCGQAACKRCPRCSGPAHRGGLLLGPRFFSDLQAVLLGYIDECLQGVGTHLLPFQGLLQLAYSRQQCVCVRGLLG